MRDLSLKRSKILIIDDEAEVVEFVRRTLEQDGYRNIASTTDPFAAIRLFEEFKPDLVLLDWLMPGLGGLHVLVELRSVIPAEAQLPILVVTGDPQIETRREALNRGASDFVTKPYDTTEILARIGNLLETRFLGAKKAEEAARESEESFFSAFEHAPIGVALVSPGGRWLRVNRALCEVIGYSEAELLASTFQDITHPDDLAGNVENALRMLAGKVRSYQSEKRYIHRSGHVVTVLLNVSLIRDGDGQPRYFITQIQDITERKQNEELLQRQKTELQVLFDLMPAMVLFKDTNNCIVRANRRVAENAGKSVAEIEGKLTHEVLPKEAAGFYADDLEVIHSGTPKLGMIRAVHDRDGNEAWIQTDKVPYRDKDGKVIGIVVVAQDITERKRADEALRESEERFSGAFEYAPIGVALVSPQGRWLRVNRALCEVVGYSETELLARTFQEITHPEDLAADLEQMRRLLAGEIRSYEMEKRYIHARGHFVRILLNVSLVRSSSGNPLHFIAQIQDITERRRAEEALHDSEERYRALIEWSPESISVQRDGQLLYVNPALIKMMGANSAQDLIGRSILDLVHQDFHQIVHERTKHNTDHGGVLAAAKERFIRLDGTVIDVEVRSRSINYDGESALYSSIRDITERKRIEDALRESEERFSTAFEFAPIGVALVSPDGRWLKVNRALCEVVGYSETELLTRTFQDITHPEDLAADLENVRRLLAGESLSYQLEKRYIHARGRLVRILVNSALVRDDLGRPCYFIAQIQDITERKQVEEELSQSRETLRGILDHIPQRVFWKDLDLVYQGCNHAFAVDVGFRDPSEVIGKTDFETSWKALAEHYRADDRSVIGLDATKSSFEEPAIGADGHQIWIRTSKSPLHDREGRVTGVLGTYEDVTEHKLAKLEIEQLNAELEERVAQRTEDLFTVTQEAEYANRAKSEFLSRTSHELRTPLSTILGFGQLLEAEENLGPEPRESIAQILEAGRRLLKLVDEVLDISNAESGKMTIALEPTTVEQLVRETLERIRSLAVTHRVDLELRPVFMRDWSVLANSQRLKQVLSNLLSNAIKYSRPDGRVILECTPAEGTDPPALRFSVRDTGPGIGAEYFARLYTPFDRLGAERTHAHVAGVGLGLAVSKRLVELMDGRIGMESVVGVGSTFWIELPLAGPLVAQFDQFAELQSKSPE